MVTIISISWSTPLSFFPFESWQLRFSPLPFIKKQLSCPSSASSWRDFLSLQHSEVVVCLKSLWYSQYLFLFLRVSMGFGRLNIRLPFISMRMLRGLVWKHLTLSSSFLGCLPNEEPLSSFPLFRVFCQTKSTPLHISMACMKSWALLRLLPMLLLYFQQVRIWTFSGAICWGKSCQPPHIANPK